MTQNTPGPWMTDEADHDAPYQDIRIIAGPHRRIAIVWIDDAPVEDYNHEQRANARLIAAAPELLEALKEAVDMYLADYEDMTTLGKKRLAVWQAAIAKAEGRT